MTEQLPVDVPGQLAMDENRPVTELVADAEWPARCRQRVREAMDVMGEQAQPISTAELYPIVAERVPLTEFDASTTKSGQVRAWTNLGWNLTTNYEHAGWLHATTSGYRLTAQGREELDSGKTPQQLYDDSNVSYKAWDERRSADLAPTAVDLEQQIAHRGSGFAHAAAATAPIVRAWRDGTSAFSPGRNVWTPAATYTLAELPADRADPTRGGAARTRQRRGSTARRRSSGVARGTAQRHDGCDQAGARARPPARLPTDPPGPANRAFRGPRARLCSRWQGADRRPVRPCCGRSRRCLQHWWSRRTSSATAAWQDPWAWRDVLARGQERRRTRRWRSSRWLVHPGAFTTAAPRRRPQRAVDAFSDRLNAPSGDVERDLRDIVIALQAGTRRSRRRPHRSAAGESRGAAASTPAAPGWSAARSISVTGCQSWMRRARSPSLLADCGAARGTDPGRAGRAGRLDLRRSRRRQARRQEARRAGVRARHAGPATWSPLTTTAGSASAG